MVGTVLSRKSRRGIFGEQLSQFYHLYCGRRSSIRTLDSHNLDDGVVNSVIGCVLNSFLNSALNGVSNSVLGGAFDSITKRVADSVSNALLDIIFKALITGIIRVHFAGIIKTLFAGIIIKPLLTSIVRDLCSISLLLILPLLSSVWVASERRPDSQVFAGKLPSQKFL